MADFNYLSDTDEEIAVEELISQAQDLCVLEQVAAIRCSSFTHSHSVLPTHLESRFRKLQSFPLTKPNPDAIFTHSKTGTGYASDFSKEEAKRVFSDPDPDPDPALKHPDSLTSSPSNSKKRDSKLTSKSGSGSGSLMEYSSPPSPPKKTGCIFWCSPKKASQSPHQKKSKENGLDYWGGMDDDFLSDLTTFSTKQQQKLLKKAMKEEQKISQEADKIVKWAKQASARLSVSDIPDQDDELSDHI